METVKATSDAVVCTLTDSEKRTRREELRAGVLALVTTVRETDDGYALGFAPRSIETVRELVAFESRCCSFMTYSIDDRDRSVTWLRLSGPDGTKDFVRAWLPPGLLTNATPGAGRSVSAAR
jgi:hypothetical protein